MANEKYYRLTTIKGEQMADRHIYLISPENLGINELGSDIFGSKLEKITEKQFNKEIKLLKKQTKK